MELTLWHPFSKMAAVPGREVVITKGDGCWLEDVNGKRYLDAIASLWYCNVGYGRDELVDAAEAQMRKLPTYHLFDVYATEPALALADRLSSIAPMPRPAVFLTNGGSDAIDTAGKMARRYWQVRGEPQRTIIVSRSESYHGMNAYGTALAGLAANAAGWGEIIPDIRHVPYDDAAALEKVLAEYPGRVAAFIGEPVIGAGGVIPPTEGYWAEIQRVCREHDVLLIADEVITGFGRTGPWFASERFGIEPDIVTGAKGLTSGYLPLGVVLAGAKVRDVLWSEESGMFRHGYTYSGHATACAVALRNLDIIEQEGLRDAVSRLEPVLAEAVDSLIDLPLVEQTRHVGLLAAVQISAEARRANPAILDELVQVLREDGVITRALGGHSLQISPPFVITPDDIGWMTDRFRNALERAGAALPETVAVP